MDCAGTAAVISSTGSPETVLNRKDIETVMAGRGGRPLMIIDIAVPRDVDPSVGDIDGVHLYDIDALESTVQQTMGRWDKDLEVCAAIIDQEIDNLLAKFKDRQERQHARSDGGGVTAVAV